jgi:Domain of unknown function (DUF4157)
MTAMRNDHRRSETRRGGRTSLPDDVKQRLSPYFPDLDMDAILVNLDGIPWYVPNKMDAFTNGYKIYFAPGRFNPRTASGIALIAHELTHCDQFRRHGTWIFRFRYGWSWLVELLRNKSFHEAYYRNHFEVEARATQDKVQNDFYDRLCDR